MASSDLPVDIQAANTLGAFEGAVLEFPDMAPFQLVSSHRGYYEYPYFQSMPEQVVVLGHDRAQTHRAASCARAAGKLVHVVYCSPHLYTGKDLAGKYVPATVKRWMSAEHLAHLLKLVVMTGPGTYPLFGESFPLYFLARDLRLPGKPYEQRAMYTDRTVVPGMWMVNRDLLSIDTQAAFWQDNPHMLPEASE